MSVHENRYPLNPRPQVRPGPQPRLFGSEPEPPQIMIETMGDPVLRPLPGPTLWDRDYRQALGGLDAEFPGADADDLREARRWQRASRRQRIPTGNTGTR